MHLPAWLPLPAHPPIGVAFIGPAGTSTHLALAILWPGHCVSNNKFPPAGSGLALWEWDATPTYPASTYWACQWAIPHPLPTTFFLHTFGRPPMPFPYLGHSILAFPPPTTFAETCQAGILRTPHAARRHDSGRFVLDALITCVRGVDGSADGVHAWPAFTTHHTTFPDGCNIRERGHGDAYRAYRPEPTCHPAPACLPWRPHCKHLPPLHLTCRPHKAQEPSPTPSHTRYGGWHRGLRPSWKNFGNTKAAHTRTRTYCPYRILPIPHYRTRT